MSFQMLVLQAALVIGCYMLCWFVLGTILKKNSVVDIAWGLGFVVLSCFAWWAVGGEFWWHHVSLVLVSLWGLRLAWHIGRRSIGKPEDWRYANWRREWGKWVVIRSFFQIYVLQGVFMLVIALPLLWLQWSHQLAWPILFWLGIVVWSFGWLCEVFADAQLAKFVQKKKPGEIMTSGLWKYSRHPNYFGEAVQWWAFFLMAFATSGVLFTVVSPLVITFLLRYVSGVPMLEKKYADNPAFQAYAQKTSICVPWFPKRS